MSWATEHIKKLQEGQVVFVRPYGGSMQPHVKSGQLVKLVPVIAETELKAGMIVLCKVGSYDYLHFIKQVSESGTNFQIGNAHGRINGWISRSDIYGVLEWKEEMLPSANGSGC